MTMKRSKFLLELAKSNKSAYVGEPGEVNTFYDGDDVKQNNNSTDLSSENALSFNISDSINSTSASIRNCENIPLVKENTIPVGTINYQPSQDYLFSNKYIENNSLMAHLSANPKPCADISNKYKVTQLDTITNCNVLKQSLCCDGVSSVNQYSGNKDVLKPIIHQIDSQILVQSNPIPEVAESTRCKVIKYLTSLESPFVHDQTSSQVLEPTIQEQLLSKTNDCVPSQQFTSSTSSEYAKKESRSTSSTVQIGTNNMYFINQMESDSSSNDLSTSEYVPPSVLSSSSSSSNQTNLEYVKNIPIPKSVDQQFTNMNYLSFTEPSTQSNQSNNQIPILPSISHNDAVNKPTSIVITTSNHLSIESYDETRYKKSASAPERPTICPICFVDVPTHFVRHLFRHHPEHEVVKKINNLKPRSNERLTLVASLRKQGYFHLNNEKNVLNPVRKAISSDTVHFPCTYCLGYYSKKLLYKHVKSCKNKPENMNKSGRNCVSESQTLMASVMSKNQDLMKSSRMKDEVMNIMRADEISEVVKKDSLIILYGEVLLNKHKRKQMANVISNKVREMGRLMIALKSINNTGSCLFDYLKPNFFSDFISATKIISGYDVSTKEFKAPSLALHMATNLKIICDIAYKVVLERKQVPNIKWDDPVQKRSDIKDLRKLIEGHFCNELSSLALKNLKERQWEKPKDIPLSSDIQAFQTHLNNRCIESYNKLMNSDINITNNYRILNECVLAITVLFNRKRVGEVQYLTINKYESDNDNINQEAFFESLSVVERIIYKKYKRVVTAGKGSKPVPILFSKNIQKYIQCLLEVRRKSDIVPQTNPYLFANPGSVNRWMSGTNIIRKLAHKCGAQHPSLLTSSKFRKHIATLLQLMSMEENEMEQIATFMGHTKKTHAEFYRLPQDIYQTSKVAKILLLLEKGRGKEFKGKSLNDIELENDIYYSSESEIDEKETLLVAERSLEAKDLPTKEKNKNDINKVRCEILPENIDTGDHTETMDASVKNLQISQKRKLLNSDKEEGRQSKRMKWTEKEKSIVIKYFRSHIDKKVTPKKHECEQLMSLHKSTLHNKGWVRIKTLVYNIFRNK